MLRPVRSDEKAAVLEVYRQCQDFLSLTPDPFASIQMVESDLEMSQKNNGLFCGIFDLSQKMMGIVDVIPHGFAGDLATAFIELLMIAAPYRQHGLGSAVVAAVEAYIQRDANIKFIMTAVMVNNPSAVRFWQRHAYETVSNPELQPDGTTVWKLKKRLA